MSLESPHSNEDGIPSFQAIVEMELGRFPQTSLNWQRPSLIPEAVMTQLLPQYDQWEFLGAGGMGVIYKAWHRELQRWAAIKFLSPQQNCDPVAQARFQNEATLLARLRHPNIVPVHDFGCGGELAWLVMDFIDGVPLQKWAQEKPRKPAEIASMVAKIARAVGVAHASGITHRDLKPGNILVVQGDEPVLLDFGLAQHIAWQQDIRLTQLGELAGTVAYLAPEQVEPSLGEPSPATDVHACGVILFELLSGRLPREGLASQIISRLHQDHLPPRLRSVVKSVRRELDAICWRAMQRRPEERYANGLSLAEDLERFLDGRPVRAKNPDFLELAYWHLRRYPWLTGAISVALAAVLFAGWSVNRMQWSKGKAVLLSQINRELTETEWTPECLAETIRLLNQMHQVDTVLERHLIADTIKRTQRAVNAMLEAPRLSNEEHGQVKKLIQFLDEQKHPEVSRLWERWRSREATWLTVTSLTTPMMQATAEEIFRPAGWALKDGALGAVPPKEDQTWSSIFSKLKLEGAVAVEAEFSATWQKAKACGISLIPSGQRDLRFYVLKADRFALYEPHFSNPENGPVMVIMSETTPLVYEILPQSVRLSEHLSIRCQYENGELSMSVNGLEPLRYSSVFESARSLPDCRFSLLIPIEAPLTRLDLRQRTRLTSESTLAKADDLVSSGKAEEALAIYEKYLNRGDIKTECLYKYAACQETLQKSSEACAAWEDVARGAEQPWKSLAMFQLWRSYLTQGNMETANAWFDLLTSSNPPEIVQTGIPTADRLLLNQHYLPLTRSLNCLKARPEEMDDQDRAVRVQQFLGADERQVAVRTAMIFHFAGQDQRARQILREAVTSLRPSGSLSATKVHMALLCLDQWAALGEADADPVLQATLTSWLHALKGNHMPALAIPKLEDIRHEMRQKLPLKKGHRETLTELITDPRVMLRHRLEAWLIKGLSESNEKLRERDWKRAVEAVDAGDGIADSSQQKLHSEFVARSLDQSWTTAQATEWIAAILGKSHPLVSREDWLGPVIQSLTGDFFAKALNKSLQGPRGQTFAKHYILRTASARELAHEGMKLLMMAIFSEGTTLPMEDGFIAESGEKIVEAFCAGNFSDIEFMQFFKLWSGEKNRANWEMMMESLHPTLKEPIAKLLNKRYLTLGYTEEASEFLTPIKHEKPMPKHERVDL